MRLRLAGRTVLITGASSGLGEHFARVFSREGARVVLGARRMDRIAALAQELGDSALAVPLDVNDEASLIAAYDAAQAHFGTIDTIVANAGMARGGRSTELPFADVAAVINTNLTGVYLTAREGARRMIEAGIRESGRGRIVLIGSITAQMTAQGDTAYAASKAAVAHLGRQFAREWIRQGINVNTIQPGYIRTEIDGDWFDSAGGQAQIAGFHRRRLMPIDSLDAAMLLLCSDESQWITGATLSVDDGQVL